MNSTPSRVSVTVMRLGREAAATMASAALRIRFAANRCKCSGSALMIRALGRSSINSTSGQAASASDAASSMQPRRGDRLDVRRLGRGLAIVQRFGSEIDCPGEGALEARGGLLHARILGPGQRVRDQLR
jgi:hypothetical protein